MSNITRQTIDLSSLLNEVSDVDAPACDAQTCRDVIVCRSASGRLDLIDGYHRVAGLLVGGQTVASVIVIAGDLDDQLVDLVGDAADPNNQSAHQAAIAALVAMAQEEGE